MDIALEQILACPKCKSKIEIVWEDKIKIRKGIVSCSHCATAYPIDDELLDFTAKSNISSSGNWKLDYFVDGYKEMAKLRDHYDWARHDRIPQLVESYRFPLMRGRLLEWLSPKDGDIILDIGCGAGLLIFQIKKIYPDKNIFILGLDVVRSNIRILIDRKNREANNGILGITGYAEGMMTGSGLLWHRYVLGQDITFLHFLVSAAARAGSRFPDPCNLPLRLG